MEELTQEDINQEELAKLISKYAPEWFGSFTPEQIDEMAENYS